MDRTEVQVGGEIRASDAVGGHTARAVDHAALHKVGQKHQAVSARGSRKDSGEGVRVSAAMHYPSEEDRR